MTLTSEAREELRCESTSLGKCAQQSSWANFFRWSGERDEYSVLMCDYCLSYEKAYVDQRWFEEKSGMYSVYLPLIRPDSDSESVIAVECFIISFCDFIVACKGQP